MEYKTFDELLQEIRASFDSEDSRDDLFYQNYIGRAIAKLNPRVNDIKVCFQEVVDLSFEKPCDYILPIEIALYDGADNVLRYKYVKGIMKADRKYPLPASQINNISIPVTTLAPLFWYPIELSEGKFCFNLSTNAKNVVKAEIKYYAWPYDDEGNMLIPTVYTEYIIAFVHFEEAQRKISKSINANGKMTEAAKFLAFFEQRMTKQLGYAKTRANPLSPLDGEYIGRAFLTKVQNLSYPARRN